MTATEPGTGIVHQLTEPYKTACGKNATGWLTEVTILQTLDLVVHCEACQQIPNDQFLDPPIKPNRYVVDRIQPWDYWRLRMDERYAWRVAEIATGQTVSPPGAYTRDEAEAMRQKLEQEAVPK